MTFSDRLHGQIRARFAHVDACPFTGPRVFFENAGGALTLNAVVETSARFAAIPDNQGRGNAASQALVEIIETAREDVRLLFGAQGGAVVFGESGTELLFRLLRDACLGAAPGPVLGSSVEHPASRSACARWAAQSGRDYVVVQHDDALGCVTPEAYAAHVTPETAVATVLHTSPVTGMGNDLAGIVRAIRAVAPGCIIIADGIQHASHGGIDVTAADVDGYVISPYKVFSRHGYGVAWASDRLTALAHDALVGGPQHAWELGTRDTGAYATMSDVVAYLDWLGGALDGADGALGGALGGALDGALGGALDGGADRRRARLNAAAKAIRAHEAALCEAMLHGIDNLPGLTEMPGVQIVGGAGNPAREGLVSFWIEDVESAAIVAHLNAEGVRCHIRKADHYSGNILTPLGRADCIRVSMCHYNSLAEVRAFLTAMTRLDRTDLNGADLDRDALA